MLFVQREDNVANSLKNVLKIKKDLNAKHQNLFVDGLQKLEFVTIVFGKQLMSAIKELLLN